MLRRPRRSPRHARTAKKARALERASDDASHAHQFSFARAGMDLGDIAAGELDNRGLAAVRCEGLDEHAGAGGSRFGERAGEIGHFVAGQLATIRPGQMAVRHNHNRLSETGFNTDAPIRLSGLADLDARRLAVVGYDLAMRERDKLMDESIGST